MANSLIGMGVGLDGSICEPFLNCCDDESVGLYNADGVSSMLFMDWLRWRKAKAGVHNKILIPYIGAEGIAANAPTSGVPADICAFGNGVEVGEPCRRTIEGFGVVKRKSDAMVDGGQLPYCEGREVVRVDGTVIDNDYEWHEANISRTLLHDMKIQMLNGIGPAKHAGVPNPNNPSGLPDHWGIIPLLDGTAATNGYGGDCGDWQSAQVLDWNLNPAVSATAPVGHGITLNGAAVGDNFAVNIFSTMNSVFTGMRNLFDRMPHLNGGLNYGDIALVMPQEAIECIITAQTCLTHCDAGITRIDNAEARNRFQQLLGGGIGYGEVVFNGNVRVPIIPFNPFDYGTNRGALVNADGSFNMMLLWRGSQAQNIFGMEYNDLSDGMLPGNRSSRVTRDNGLFQLGVSDVDDCLFLTIRSGWRVNYSTLCLQALIKNVVCDSLQACEPDFSTVTALPDC